ncbi:MAG: YbhB/YbcL family Raf kinase inhibitor-like protein [Victivallales bacterium]|nr:YbhB/YbcL family Raf kinase inhibitor-like protein [Victivallales bacterium]
MTRRMIFRFIVMFVAGTALTAAAEPAAMQMASIDFPSGAAMPRKYTLYGANISPELHWQGVPPGTAAVVVSCIDSHRMARQWVHWLVINIDPVVTSLPEGCSRGMLPHGAVELKNSFGTTGYGGPQPPAGTGDHVYIFTVYALREPLPGLGPDSFVTAARLRELLRNRVLGQASCCGSFRR